MWPDNGYAPSRGSFEVPIPAPGTDPTDAPTKTVSVNCQWLPYIRGALMQLVLQSTWIPTTPGELTQAQMRAMTLISLFEECGSSELPIACPYDFRFGDMGGWQPFVHDGCPLAIWDGSGFTPGCGPGMCGGCGSYTQLQIIKSLAPTVRVLSITITYTSASDLVWSLADDTAPVNAPAGVFVSSSEGVNRDESAVRVIIDQNEANQFHLDKVELIYTSTTGVCQ